MSGERKKPHRAELRYANANDTFNRNFHAALSANRSRRGGGVNYATIAHCFPGVKNSQGSQMLRRIAFCSLRQPSIHLLLLSQTII